MDRDDFSMQTRDYLAKRVGVRCSNSLCRRATTGPRTETPLVVNIGVAAHITAASVGGPRYNPALSSDQRKSAENGIWLCQNCAKLIDNDPTRYSAEVLLEWRFKAETSARAELEGSAEQLLKDSFAEMDISYSKDRITQERHDYCLRVTLFNGGIHPLGAYHVDLAMPGDVVSNPRAQRFYLPENSTPDVAFSRASSTDEKEIYPGDTRVVISVPYHVDRNIYWGAFRGYRIRHSFEDICNQSVMVTLYHHGFRRLSLERRFGEFQVF